METDETQPGMSGPHPTMAELRDPSHPAVSSHIAQCSMCRSIISAAADNDVPIPLDLPKGLVSESAFKWPADPMARGGMAQIFQGEDRRLGRTVILKAPREGEDLAAGMAEMFQRRVSAEARILAKLQHPSIVTIYELGKSSVGWPFCVLEKVDGVSLRDRLDELADQETADGGRPRMRERLELLSNVVAVAEALAYAHERRIVHRDVTPNNILLGKRGEATLIDWGIARDLDAPGGSTDPSLQDEPPSMSGRMVTISAGTPPYLPLEQSQGRQATAAFDVYSFGITLYEVVSGRTPFEWKHVEPGQRTAQVQEFIEWLNSDDEIPPAMPRDRELSGIIARAIAKDPVDRFTADELVRALKQYLTGDLVFSHRYSLAGRLARWASRHRAAAVTMVFVVASGVAGALVWAQLSRQAREEADLRTLAAAARADAGEKQQAADAASREAEAAKARAEQAEREGKDAKQLRLEADRKRRSADDMRKSAEAAATQAKGDADEAIKRFQAAMKEKDEADRLRDVANGERDTAKAAQVQAEREREAARASQSASEKERDAAKAAREAADKERDAAKQTAAAAQADRDAAKAAREASDKERDAARASQVAAEKERDAAASARAGIEKERDDARRKVAELEAKLKEQQAPPPGPPPPPPSP
jgi:tRNA A-37 threonylcarbamoyl transferase component Bud32